MSKISTSEIDKNRTMIKEPYFAEIEMVGGRTSTVPLDYFLCGKVEGEKYTYAFFDPDVFISVLIASHLDFKISKPNWLREHIKERLSQLMSLL